jgi:hypothetical protein
MMTSEATEPPNPKVSNAKSLAVICLVAFVATTVWSYYSITKLRKSHDYEYYMRNRYERAFESTGRSTNEIVEIIVKHQSTIPDQDITRVREILKRRIANDSQFNKPYMQSMKELLEKLGKQESSPNKG